jgi:hypothetical protein
MFLAAWLSLFSEIVWLILLSSDIVDSRSSKGNVWYMLGSSISPGMDQTEDEPSDDENDSDVDHGQVTNHDKVLYG